VIGTNEEQIQLNKGQVIVTTISNKRATLDTLSTVVTVDSQGNIRGPTPMSQPLMNFADLGAPVTNLAFADAQNANNPFVVDHRNIGRRRWRGQHFANDRYHFANGQCDQSVTRTAKNQRSRLNPIAARELLDLCLRHRESRS